MANNVKCVLCKKSDIDEVKYGKFITKRSISVHYFCLLLTSNLVQNGNDNDGILGFLIKDIKNEAHRIQKQICCYCNNDSAGIGCCDKKCRRIFHLSCGIQAGALNQFSGTFRSFCNNHIPKKFRHKLPSNTNCSICYDIIKVQYTYTESCITPCCQNGWFHKYCLQEFSNHAGYFFKCPLCNNKKEFREILSLQGIFVPDQDAAWELEPNAFADLYERPNECSATDCLCQRGRQYNNSNEYEIIFCDTCGSKAIHVLCNGNNENDFICDDCTKILSLKNDENELNNASVFKSDLKEEDDDDDSDFVNVEDIDDINTEITAAQAFRNSINNHPLATNSPEDFENFLNTKVINKTSKLIIKSDSLQEIREKSYINHLSDDGIINLSGSEDDEIIELTNSKKRKIISDSDDNIENNMIKSRTRSQSRLQYSGAIVNNKSNNRNRRNSISESNDDEVIQLKKRKIISDSDDKIENNIKIRTRIQSRLQSSDDINLIVNNNTKTRINSPLDVNITDSSQNSPILQCKDVKKKSLKTAIISSEDNIPLKYLINKNSIPNNIIFDRNMDKIDNELIIENDLFKNNEKTDKFSNNTSRSNTQFHVRQFDDNISNEKKYCTRLNSQNSKLYSNRIPSSKLERYQRENSESSLSSADVKLKERIKYVIEDNARKKQTPINRNIPSSSSSTTTRLKSRFNKLKSNNNSSSSSLLCITASSSSSASSDLTTSTNSSIKPTIKLRKRLVSTTTSEYSPSDVKSNVDNKIPRRSLRTSIKKCINNQNYKNSDLKKRSKIQRSSSTESNSDCSSSNSSSLSKSQQIRLHIDSSESDGDDFVDTIIKNINNNNNKENEQCKDIFNKNKKTINNNNRNYDKLKKPLATEYVEFISITIRERQT